MSRDITIALIGLGNRGISLLEQVILPQKVCVAAVCDVDEDRREAAAKIITDAGQGEPLKTDDYMKILEMEERARKNLAGHEAYLATDIETRPY